MDLATWVGIVLGVLGLVGSVFYGRQSRAVEKAFTRYVELEAEADRLKEAHSQNVERIAELEQMKADVYRHKYQPKDTTFRPGDRVRLRGLEPEADRGWITEHAKPGMTGIVVDYGPGVYDYQVYWSKADYEGEPIDEHDNRWQSFWVQRGEIERIG